MKTLVIIALGLVGLLTAYGSGYNAAGSESAPAEATAYPAPFTSQDVWAAVNDYRASKGIAPLQVYPPLCDNLVARYHAIEGVWNHDGFQEFVDAQVDSGIIPASMSVTEVFATGQSPEETVQAWVGSMGHELAITTNNRGCGYTHNGLSIILMAD